MRQRVLVTGATSGIGLALARGFADDADLLLTGRRVATGAGQAFRRGAAYVAADQRDPQTACNAVVAAIDELGWDGIDLAILNAGAGFAGDPADESAAIVRETIDVNATAPMLLAHALYPSLFAAGGRLVMIGSVAHRGASGFAAYAASKAALHGFARALAEEWRGRVTVQVIHPGPTATGIHAKAGFETGGAERYFLAPETMARMIRRIMKSDRPVSTASYARFVLGGYWLGRGA